MQNRVIYVIYIDVFETKRKQMYERTNAAGPLATAHTHIIEHNGILQLTRSDFEWSRTCGKFYAIPMNSSGTKRNANVKCEMIQCRRSNFYSKKKLLSLAFPLEFETSELQFFHTCAFITSTIFTRRWREILIEITKVSHAHCTLDWWIENVVQNQTYDFRNGFWLCLYRSEFFSSYSEF